MTMDPCDLAKHVQFRPSDDGSTDVFCCSRKQPSCKVVFPAVLPIIAWEWQQTVI
jgi:hypothetical protein